MRRFRWKVLIFDDEQLVEILRAAGLAQLGWIDQLPLIADDSPDPLLLTEQYAVDIFGFRSLRAAQEFLEQRSERGHEWGCDYALVDWKDEALEKSGEGILMGYLLALECRRRNADTTIALMSVYPEQVKEKFEAAWVQRILMSASENTFDISSQVAAYKTKVWVHKDLRAAETQKAVRVLLEDSSALPGVVDQILRLAPSIRRGFPEAVRTSDLKAAREWCHEQFNGVIAGDRVSYTLRELFPFNTSALLRDFGRQWVNASALPPEDRKFSTEALLQWVAACEPALSGHGRRGSAIVKRLTLTNRYNEGSAAGTAFDGLHAAQSGDDVEAHLTALQRELLPATERELARLEEPYRALTFGDELRRSVRKVQEAAGRGDAAAAVEVERLSHELFRVFPVEAIYAAFAGQTEVRASDRPLVAGKELGPGTDMDGKVAGLWMRAVKSDVNDALKALRALFAQPPVVSCAVRDVPPQTKIVSLTLTWAAPTDTEGVRALASGAGAGNATMVLRRLAMYFAVAIGNEKALAPFPSAGLDVPPGSTTRLQLTAALGKGDWGIAVATALRSNTI